MPFSEKKAKSFFPEKEAVFIPLSPKLDVEVNSSVTKWKFPVVKLARLQFLWPYRFPECSTLKTCKKLIGGMLLLCSTRFVEHR